MSSKMSKYSPSDAKVVKREIMPAGESRWIALNKITYNDPTGKERTWESAERQTRPKGTDLDGIGVVAIIEDPNDASSRPSLLLQKQFRPPINKVTIEVPSGLIDAGESPVEAAIRELKEETGYVATIPKEGGSSGQEVGSAEGFIMFNDPGFCNTNTKMVFVQVDMTDERNKNLKPELEESEFIESFLVPLDELWTKLGELEKEGFAIDARVGTLAQGMEVARLWSGKLGWKN